MNRQGNIISFDDARRLASAQSASSEGAYASRSAAYPMYADIASGGTLDVPTAYAPADTFDDFSGFVSPFSDAASQKHSGAASPDAHSPSAYRSANYSRYSKRSADLSGYASVSSSGRISRIDEEG